MNSSSCDGVFCCLRKLSELVLRMAETRGSLMLQLAAHNGVKK
ncbi:hypothetical protein NPIL_204711, partial [Nephila pilipes]